MLGAVSQNPDPVFKAASPLWAGHHLLWRGGLGSVNYLSQWSQIYDRTPVGYTTNLAEHTQAFLGKPRSTETQLAIRVKWYYEAHLGSSQVFRFRFNARSRERGIYRVASQVAALSSQVFPRKPGYVQQGSWYRARVSLLSYRTGISQKAVKSLKTLCLWYCLRKT